MNKCVSEIFHLPSSLQPPLQIPFSHFLSRLSPDTIAIASKLVSLTSGSFLLSVTVKEIGNGKGNGNYLPTELFVSFFSTDEENDSEQ
jgi:hypothetical protein